MANIGTLTVRLIAQATQFEKTLQNATRMMTSSMVRMQKQANSMQKLGTAMTLGISAPLAGAGIATLKMAGDMEQTRIAFTNMLGSAEKSQQFLDQLSRFAEKTPFEYTDLTQQARRLMAFGFAAEEVIPMLTAIGDSVAAMGGNADMLDRVSRALSQMRAKQKVSAEEMLQLAEAGIPAYQYLAQAIGKSVPETMKLAEKGLIPANVAINSILNAMGKNFGGMMAKQANTMNGAWSNLLDVLGRAGRTFGDMINKTLGITQKIQALTAWIGGLADSLDRLNPILKTTIVWLGIGAISTGPLILGMSILARISAFASAGIAMLSRWIRIATEAFIAWKIGAGTLQEVLMLYVGKTRLIIFGIIGIVTATILVIKYWDKLKTFAVAVWNTIGGIALYGASLIVRGIGAIIYITSIIIPAFKGISNAVLGFADSLKAVAGQAFISAKSALAMAKAGQQVAQNQQGISTVGQKAANSQEQLANATENAAKAAENNLQSFDEVHQIQDQVAQSPVSNMEVPALDTSAIAGGGTGDIGANLAQGWTNTVQTISSLWDNLKTKAIQTFPWIQNVINGVSRAIQWARENWDSIAPVLESVAGILLIVGAAWLIATNPVAAFIAAGTLVAILAGYIISNWEKLEPILGPIWERIKAFILPIWESLKTAAGEIFEGIYQTVVVIWTRIQQWWSVWGQTVLAIIDGIWRQIQITVTTAINLVKDIINIVLAIIRGDWGAAWQYLLDVVETVWNYIAQTWENIKQTTINVWTSICDNLIQVWNTISTKTSEIWSSISTWLAGMWDSINTKATGIWNTIAGWIGQKWAEIKQNTESIWNGLKGWLSGTWDKIASGLSGVWSGIKDTASRLWNEIVNVIKTPINRIIDLINSVIDKMNSFKISIPKISLPGIGPIGGGSIGINIPKIPKMAEGGIVTRPTLAMIGEAGPEAIVPLSRAENSDDIARAVYQAMMDAYRMQNATQNNSDREIVLKLDSATFARLILPAVIKEGQRQGLNLVVRPQGV